MLETQAVRLTESVSHCGHRPPLAVYARSCQTQAAERLTNCFPQSSSSAITQPA